MIKGTKIVDLFKSNADIHKLTASKVFNVPSGKVTSEMRRLAKVINYFELYGINLKNKKERR